MVRKVVANAVYAWRRKGPSLGVLGANTNWLPERRESLRRTEASILLLVVILGVAAMTRDIDRSPIAFVPNDITLRSFFRCSYVLHDCEGLPHGGTARLQPTMSTARNINSCFMRPLTCESYTSSGKRMGNM